MTDVTTPPTIGAAIRFITSDPVPVLHMMGMRPAMMTEAVIAFGRILFTAPSRLCRCWGGWSCWWLVGYVLDKRFLEWTPDKHDEILEEL